MLKRKLLAAIAVIVILTSSLLVFLGDLNFLTPKTQQTIGKYLSFDGNVSKIFLVAATTGYSEANETYVATDGHTVSKGSLLFVITATLRNDYTSDNPPPYNGVQISPADGTAYVYLTSQLYSKDGNLNATDVTVPDFTIPSTPGAALVLASGQTASVNICLTVNQRNVSDYKLVVIFIVDSIPT